MYPEGPWLCVMVPSGVGIMHSNVVLFSPDLRRSQSLDLTVDTGSLFTWVPEEIAARLGHRALRTLRFRTIDGRTVERSVCDAPIEVEGLQGIVRVVLAKPGDVSVLGVTALETLALVVDPATNTLRQEDATLALVAA